MSENTAELSKDAGEYVPYARKHFATLRGSQGQDSLTLAELWPTPDWKALVANGMPADLAAVKFVIYESLRNTPRAAGVHGINGDDWSDAYKTAVLLVREIVECASTPEEIRDINGRLLQCIGYSADQLKRLPVKQAIVFWAAGMGGERKLKSIGSGTLRLHAMKRWLAKMGWPESDAAWKTSITPVELTNHTWRVGRVEGNGWYLFADTVFSNEEDALLEAIRRAEKEVEEKHKASKLVPRRPTAQANDTRVGPDFRAGDDVSPDRLMSEFGLRAIQFGNSVSIKDRQRWLNQTFDALADLADVLGMKRKWLGLKFQERSLALAIGARGHGAYAAHYEPDLKIINQTYRNGAGSLAHEFSHGLDHRIGNRFGRNCYGTHCAWYAGASITDDLQKKKMEECISDIGVFVRSSKYLSQSETIARQHRAGAYWTKTEELFARGLEAFVQDKLIRMGRVNPWLVHGTLEVDYQSGASIACPYPVGDERTHLNLAFQRLLDAMLSK